MTVPLPHICVCICTFKRPEMLRRLLSALRALNTSGRFSISVAVVDNDMRATAAPVVEEMIAAGGIELRYSVEPQQNIALARNRVCSLAAGEFLAWIDDDEFPGRDWLLRMLHTCQKTGAAGVLGPVLPHFDDHAPRWVVDGGLYDRPRHPTGFRLAWQEARTGNVLIRKNVVDEIPGPFLAEFPNGGEDQDFFRRAMEKGHSFVWCDEGEVFETVPPTRWKRSVMLRRALLRGRNSIKHPAGRGLNIIKSVVAVPAYLLLLPFILILGQGLFMRFMIKLCDHLGRLLAAVNLNPVSERAM